MIGQHKHFEQNYINIDDVTMNNTENDDIIMTEYESHLLLIQLLYQFYWRNVWQSLKCSEKQLSFSVGNKNNIALGKMQYYYNI